MGNVAQRTWRVSRPVQKARIEFDQTIALGGVTVALFSYIVYHFVYPLIAKGLLF